MGDVSSWSVTAATNANADSTINFSEGQSPSTLNDSSRSLMAALKQQQLDMSGTLNSTGAGSVYAVTLNQSPTQYNDGLRFAFTANVDCGDNPQVIANSLGVKNLQRADGGAIYAGDIIAGQVLDCVYSTALGYVRVLNLLTRPRTKVISFTRGLSSASGSVSYTGVGFRPRTIHFLWGMNVIDGWNGLGFSDSYRSGGSMATNSANGGQTSNATPVMIGNVSASNAQTATVSSYDSDGFTLAWTKVGSPSSSNTMTVYALCSG